MTDRNVDRAVIERPPSFRRLLVGLAALTLLVGARVQSAYAQARGLREVRFDARDGGSVFADLHLAAAGLDAPLILLFHQAGASVRGEYREITPRLVEAGYSVLQVDLRSGGGQFGGINRTVARRRGGDAGYCAVFPDLEAALRYAKGTGVRGGIVAWGSSYSAALVMQLAATYPDDVRAVLAFSPASGPPMEGCAPERFAADLTVPVLVLRPDNEMRSNRVRRQLEQFDEMGFETFVANGGVHGSSMLVGERSRGPVAPTWDTVLDFLARVTVSGGP